MPAMEGNAFPLGLLIDHCWYCRFSAWVCTYVVCYSKVEAVRYVLCKCQGGTWYQQSHQGGVAT